MKRIQLLIVTTLMLASILALGTTRAEAAYTYTYDAAGRLTKVTLNDGSRIIYAYDTAGNVLQQAFTVKRALNEAIVVLQVLAKIPTVSIGSNADVTSDGKIGLEDAIYLLQKLSEVRP
jgi:YD repeat-containing protein